MVQVTSPTSLAVDSPQGRKLFVFDKVFGQDVQQDGVWEYVSESVNSFLQGYNVSVMAYGQSGAGKSFTMGTSGPTEQGNKYLMGEHQYPHRTVRLSDLTWTDLRTLRCDTESSKCAFRKAQPTPEFQSPRFRDANAQPLLHELGAITQYHEV